MNTGESTAVNEILAHQETNQPHVRDEVPRGHTKVKVTLEDSDFDETEDFPEASDADHRRVVVVVNGGIACGVFVGDAIVELDDPSGLILNITESRGGDATVIEVVSPSKPATVRTTVTD